MDMYRRQLILFFFVLTCVWPMDATDAWIKVTTPNFVMYTTNDEKDAARALQVFERVRYFFIKSSPSKPVSASPVRIVAFRSEREYAPYRLNAGAFAYYVRSHDRDYIVMQDIEPAHYPAAMHEYTHLIVEHLNLHFPIWLNEGLAEFYSSLEARGSQAVVGGVLPGRLAMLKSKPWLDLKLLFSIEQNSPYYNERDKMSIFYAESWALTHMLELGDTYRSRFPDFLSAVASGKTVEDCLRSIYGKDLDGITADLHTYVNPATLRAGIVDVNLPRSAFDTKTVPLPAVETELALTDLLASRKQTWGEASKRLRKLAEDYPGNVEIEESIAYLEWQRNQTSSARDHIARAVQLGSTDPDVLYLYAQLLHQTNASDAEVLAVLEKVVAARPDFADAQLNLALTAMNLQNWGRAAVALSSMKTIQPDRAFDVFSAIATCDLSLGHVEAARQVAERAQQYAKTSEEKAEARKLIAQFQSIEVQQPPLAAEPEPAEVVPTPSAPPTPPVVQESDSPKHPASPDEPMIHWAGDIQHVEATAQTFECHGKELRLHVQVDSRPMVFQIDDPNAILIRNAGSKSVELTCGPQKPFHLGIFYIPAPDSAAIAGKVRELVF
jgi:tetratricopeptide (TPR) repeat protein